MEYVVTGASVFVLWGISAAVAGLIANDRERNPWAFAAITFFFLGPLGVGLAILAPHGAVERARLISARATLAGVAKRKAARAAAEAAESAEPETAGSDAPADGVQSAAAVEEPVVEVVEAVEVAEAAAEPVAEVEVAAVEVAAVEPEPVVVQPEAADVDGHHRGLANMRARAAEHGGTFDVQRARIGGVRVVVRIPREADQ